MPDLNVLPTATAAPAARVLALRGSSAGKDGRTRGAGALGLVFLLLALSLGALDSHAAGASDEGGAEGPEPNRYLLGARVATHNSWSWQDRPSRQQWSPAAEVMWGRWHLRSRSPSLLKLVADEDDDHVDTAAASVQLARREVWDLGLTLRYNDGRKAEAVGGYAPLPEIKSSLRARLTLRRALGERWSAFASYGNDITHRAGGAQFRLGAGYQLPWTDRGDIGFGSSLVWADRQQMVTHFGVPAAAGAGWPAAGYAPSGGLKEWAAHVTVRQLLGRHWGVYATATATRLLGDAAASPIVRDPVSYTLAFGLAWHGTF